ncbi:MAG TPA: hypothetical protein VFV68_17690 [Agriterribacter sp.]|nr:hypothetical protein [Agriterribacter sp.]
MKNIIARFFMFVKANLQAKLKDIVTDRHKSISKVVMDADRFKCLLDYENSLNVLLSSLQQFKMIGNGYNELPKVSAYTADLQLLRTNHEIHSKKVEALIGDPAFTKYKQLAENELKEFQSFTENFVSRMDTLATEFKGSDVDAELFWRRHGYPAYHEYLADRLSHIKKSNSALNGIQNFIMAHVVVQN